MALAPTVQRDELGGLVGWRGWRVARSESPTGLVAHLISPVMGDAWPRGPMTASCADKHPPANWNCTCGIYAFAEPFAALEDLRSGSLAPPAAVGKVRGWGSAVLHTFGWRAQHVQLQLIFFEAGLRPEFATELEHRYDVPVVGVRSLREVSE